MYIMNIRTKYRIYIQTFLKTLLSVTHTHTHTHFYILNTEPTYRLSYRLSSLSHTHIHIHTLQLIMVDLSLIYKLDIAAMSQLIAFDIIMYLSGFIGAYSVSTKYKHVGLGSD